jgi:hypothetical protein
VCVCVRVCVCVCVCVCLCVCVCACVCVCVCECVSVGVDVPSAHLAPTAGPSVCVSVSVGVDVPSAHLAPTAGPSVSPLKFRFLIGIVSRADVGHCRPRCLQSLRCTLQAKEPWNNLCVPALLCLALSTRLHLQACQRTNHRAKWDDSSQRVGGVCE